MKRTRKELMKMPRPHNPAELEVLSHWYFGMPLHLSLLYIYVNTAQYQVLEEYKSYHGDGFNFSAYSCDGYDYSSVFWNFVIGELCCGGIAAHSYGQAHIRGHRDMARLKRFEGFMRGRQSGRLRKPYERLALLFGEGENTATHDSGVLITGRVDGAVAVS